MKRTFTVVNDFASIASKMPQGLNPETLILLQREGSSATTRPKFRPFAVNKALDCLLMSNVTFYDAVQGILVTYLPEGEDAVGVFEGTIPISSKQDDLLERHLNSSDSSTVMSEESDVVLLHQEASSIRPTTTTEDVLRGIGAPPSVFEMKRIDIAKWPSEEPRYYELSFPHLYAYGKGGLGGVDCKLTKADLIELKAKRGGDRRFSMDKFWMAAVYTDVMRNKSNGVSYVASKAADESAAALGITEPSVSRTAGIHGGWTASLPSSGLALGVTLKSLRLDAETC